MPRDATLMAASVVCPLTIHENTLHSPHRLIKWPTPKSERVIRLERTRDVLMTSQPREIIRYMYRYIIFYTNRIYDVGLSKLVCLLLKVHDLYFA